jgi:PAS domain-containing protein
MMRADARAHFKVILDHIVDGVVVQDTSAQLVYLNPAAARLLGHPSVEAALKGGIDGLLKDFAALFDETGVRITREALPGRAALRGELEPARVVRVKLVDESAGPWKWAWVKASSVRSDETGEPIYVVTVFSEITNMKKTEQGLIDANQRVVNLLEKVLDASDPS